MSSASKASHCTACGASAPEGAVFCPKCGKSLTGSDPPSHRPASLTGPGSAPSEPETDLWTGSYSWKGMIGSWFGAFFLTIVFLVGAYFAAGHWKDHAWTIWGVAGGLSALLWIGNALILLYRQMSISYRLTSQLLVIQRGIVFVTFDRIELMDIDDISVSQGIIDRILGVGTISILSSDVSDPKLDLIGITDVQTVAEILDKARRKRREKAVRMEAI